MVKQRTTTNPKPIPEILKVLEPSCKTIWLYVQRVGTVKISQRKLGENLGISTPTVGAALISLRKNALLEGDFKPRKVPTFKAVTPEIKEVATD